MEQETLSDKVTGPELPCMSCTNMIQGVKVSGNGRTSETVTCNTSVRSFNPKSGDVSSIMKKGEIPF